MTFQRLIRYSFYLLFILVPLIFLPNTSELFEFNKIIVTYLLTVVIVSAWIGRMISEKKFIFRPTLLDWPLIVFLVIQFVSLMLSIDVHTSINGYYSRWNGGFISLLSYILLYWAFVSNMTHDAVRKTINYAVGAAIAVSFWGILEHFGIDKDLWVQDVQNRVFSTMGQPNWLAAYLVTLIWIPVSKLRSISIQKDKNKAIFNGILFIILFTTLLYTKSRSGLMAFGLSAAVYWGTSLIKQSKERGTYLIASAFAVITLLFTLVTSNPARDLVIKSTSPAPVGPALEVGGTESGNIRKIVWTGAFRIWQSNLKNTIIGTGPETFTMAYYQHRPIEHNQTSEWELLYNKAHNEFLNYLATTGFLGLASYIAVLVAIILVFIKSLKRANHSSNKDSSKNIYLELALLSGWISIPVTNFWGFSVVTVQLMMFLLPAFVVVTLQPEINNSEKQRPASWIVFLILVLTGAILIGRYWLADVSLAAAQKNDKYFQATQNGEYLALAQQNAAIAYRLNKNEPVIASELSNTAAYLALAISQSSTDSAQQLAELSVVASDQAIKVSPFHPNHYKSRSRSFILLSELNPGFLNAAAVSLEKAMVISPTDPRLPFNLGVIYKYLGQKETAKEMWEKSLQLKPDFADPKKQLDELEAASKP